MDINLTDISRFWSFVKKRGEDDCWYWHGTTTHGYGEISIHYKKFKAHRLSYILTHGDIPAGLIVRHTCDVTQCCNPKHLVLGTPADNSRDMVVRSRSKQGTKHHNAKLSEDDIRAIRKDNRSQKFVAKLYGVTQSRISMIKSRKNWSHVNDNI